MTGISPLHPDKDDRIPQSCRHHIKLQWTDRSEDLSPAYDLTYSNTYYGEHTTTIDGNGRNPGRKELLAVGIAAGMRRSNCERIIDTIQACVSQMLGEYM